MEMKNVNLELTGKQYLDLIRLLSLGYMVAEEVSDESELSDFREVQQMILAAPAPGKGSIYAAYDSKEDEYFLADDVEDKLIDLIEEYDDLRFWEILTTRLTLRDFQNKYSDKELEKMSEEKGLYEMGKIHEYYTNEFDENDLDNLKVVTLKKV